VLDDGDDLNPFAAHTPCWLRGLCALTGSLSEGSDAAPTNELT
jgi:hypothetical protein